MSDFTKTIAGFRFVQTQYGDTLQAIALRELGDASQWSNLAWLNGLVPPYLTDNPQAARTGVLVTGASIRVPAATSRVDAGVNPEDVFLVDCALPKGQFEFENGDFAMVSGRANLSQAIAHRMMTDHGELLFHGTYGANLGRLKGSINGPALEMVGADYARESLLDEERIQSVKSVVATTAGDVLSINAEVAPITGAAMNVTGVV